MRRFTLTLPVGSNMGPFDIFYDGKKHYAIKENGNICSNIPASDLIAGLNILVPLNAVNITIYNKKYNCENYQYFSLNPLTPTPTPTVTLTPPPTPTVTVTATPPLPTVTVTPTNSSCSLDVGVSNILCGDIINPACSLGISVSNIDCNMSTGSGQIYNVFSRVPYESQSWTFSPEKFDDVSIPLAHFDYLNIDTPTYLMSFESYNDFWINKNVDPYTKGIYSTHKGNMVQCLDYWVPECGGVYDNFISALPYHNRMGKGGFGTDPLGSICSAEFIMYSSSQDVYNFGRTLGGSFGKGDQVPGYGNRVAINSFDFENGTEDGGTLEKSRGLGNLIAGMSEAIQGFVYPLYVASLFTFGAACSGRYPKADGTFNYQIPNDDYPWVIYTISKVWYDQLDINGTYKYLSTYKNIREVEEITHYSEESFDQGYQLKNSNGTVLRTLNHFGLVRDDTGVNGYNVRHLLSRAITMVETSVAYCETQNRDFVSMLKVICDGGTIYLWYDHTDVTHGGQPAHHLPRNISFEAYMMIFMSGAKGCHIWDYPIQGLDLDAYNGVLGSAQYIFRKYDIGGTQKSIADIRNNLTFNRWNSEISYDNGVNYEKVKAIDWQKSKNHIPLRTAFTNDGYAIIFACRPYNVEPTSCKWRININNTYYTGDITANDWLSCYPVEQPTRKDFVFKFVKLF